MNTLVLIGVLLALSSLGYHAGRRKVAGQTAVKLHSLPVHYGSLVALWCALPCLAVLLVRVVAEDHVAQVIMSAELSQLEPELDASAHKLRLAELDRLTHSDIELSATEGHSWVLVERQRLLLQTGSWWVSWALVMLPVIAIMVSLRRIPPRFKARNEVESFIRISLAACSLVAILSTIGIVLSVLFEAIRYFDSVPVFDFLFGTVWSPQTAIRRSRKS